MSQQPEIAGAFSEEQVERLTGVTAAQLRRWHRTSFFSPSLVAEAGGAPFGRIYSFKDLVSLRVLNKLRNVHNVSMKELRRTAETLRHLGEQVWTTTTLYVLRGKVVFDEPESLKKREVNSKQFVVDIPLEVAITGTREAVAEMNRRGAGDIGQISRRKYVSHRAPVISGTRIPVRVIKEFADAGYSPDQIVREYPDLTLDDVQAALAYSGATAA